MKQQKVVIIDWGYTSYAHEKKVLEEAGYELEVYQGSRGDRTGRLKMAREAVGMFCRWTIIDKDFLGSLPHLKAIVRYGVGFDNIDLKAATELNIRVCNVQGYANHSVSDHTIALMYACLRGLLVGQKQILSHYAKPPMPEIFELHDKTLGIIGLGRIGGTFCKKVRPLFQKVLAYDPYIPNERFKAHSAVKSDFHTLLNESHVISLHCCLTPETTHLINRQAFGQMKKRPILLNTARGLVIDEMALLEALDQNRIHSAGLDVFSEEPPVNRARDLLAHPRVISTGHYAWYSDVALKNLQQKAAENMVRMLRGEIPEDCLNP